jgi:hypothetical protein
VDVTAPEPKSSIAGRDLGFDIQTLIVRADQAELVARAFREQRPGAVPQEGFWYDVYLGEVPWSIAADNPDWTWDSSFMPSGADAVEGLVLAGNWHCTGESSDAALGDNLTRAIPAREFAGTAGLVWDGSGPRWSANGQLVLECRATTGTFRDVHHSLLGCEQWLSNLLSANGWGLVFLITGEKHLYNDNESMSNGIASWMLFGAAVGFNGSDWDIGDWRAFVYPPGRIQIDDARDTPILVPADPACRTA